MPTFPALPPLDRQSVVPLADQIEDRLRSAIEGGGLLAGTRLMSIRQLAAHLGVSPNTVVAAYDRLVAGGLAESRGTTGYVVAEAGAAMPQTTWLEAGEEQEPVWLAQQANDQRAGVLLASSGVLPPAWLQDGIPASIVQRALARHDAGLAARCPPQGMPQLRERIAMLMRSQGMPVDASRLLTTWGATHAIDLVCRAFLQPGDTVLVENPGYFLMFGRLRDAGVLVVPVERRHDGLDLAQLETACREHRPKLLFLQSAVHNPTGWSASPANLHRVLLLAHQFGLLVVEDDTHGHFHPGHPTRLAQLSGLDRVIYCSSFCKAVSPALRMGYIAAQPDLLRLLMRQKIYTVLTTGALNELVLLELLATGRWRKHIDRLQRRIAAATAAATRQLAAAGVLLDHPGEAGLFLWGRLPAGVDVDELVRDAYRERIVLMRGAAFRADGADDPHIRFNAAFSQHVRLADYLRGRLSAHAISQAALRRAQAA
ncbi:MAG TPA: PLP-dependent aminotransferase family protein [Ramlibacter sp.]|jgi:DNA-binding transcriptional MocR family regulator|uniref:aminotransferase-like domain-containing protein n=1 Tax=Ramlibacter sp. TaxID=1917967 RepID=UPI002D2CC0B9|nr:PLP-dependent aminotransferase family protein [Ramlibacter sp.]HZY18812.1 PLP-dependent aminotransferase family protein [Ramlibacter sp.]